MIIAFTSNFVICDTCLWYEYSISGSIPRWRPWWSGPTYSREYHIRWLLSVHSWFGTHDHYLIIFQVRELNSLLKLNNYVASAENVIIYNVIYFFQAISERSERSDSIESFPCLAILAGDISGGDWTGW
jgi:hypothetical protein